jgi:pilus assembly protein CpaB
MQNRLRLAIVLAISFGLIAAYGIANYLRQQRQAAEDFRKSIQDVVVAAKEIPAGAAITPDMVKVTPYLKTSAPPGSFNSPQQVQGKVVKSVINLGEPILQSRLGEKAGLPVILTPGHRAVAVRVNEFIGVSGFIAPNDHVDVIVHITPPGSSNTDAVEIAKIVLQNKRVLSVAQTIEERKDGKPQPASSITLELTPAEAEKLSVASLQGQIVLALRPIQDDQFVYTQGTTARDLLNLTAPPPPTPVRAEQPPPPLTRYRVEVYNGTKRSELEF